MKGFVISGTGSGVGKTSITTGIMSLLSKNHKVQGFKIGPDFIDPMYHSVATCRPARNLDSFMMDDARIRNLVGFASKDADVCVIEGVRGLYEGFAGDSDLGSTAYIAKLLNLPVILVVDAGSLTRSSAAIINGFRSFDPDVKIAGVILNKVSGPQHSDKLDVSMSTYCKGIEVVGKIRKDRDVLMGIAESTDSDLPSESPYIQRDISASIAVPYDDAYCFYYRENLECLEASGFKVKRFSPVAGETLPDCDSVYLGGGYPELHADAISANKDFLEGVKNASLEEKPILGECGGLMSLCSGMVDPQGKRHDMIGIFDCDSVFVNKRHGPTYVMADATPDNPLFEGYVRAHEYHYSEVTASEDSRFGFDVKRGTGIVDRKDGLVFKKSLGTYMHQHALSSKDWAKGFCENLQ